MLDITAALQKASKKYQFLKKIGSKKPNNPKYQILDLKSQYRSIFPELGTNKVFYSYQQIPL